MSLMSPVLRIAAARAGSGSGTITARRGAARECRERLEREPPNIVGLLDPVVFEDVAAVGVRDGFGEAVADVHGNAGVDCAVAVDPVLIDEMDQMDQMDEGRVVDVAIGEGRSSLS